MLDLQTDPYKLTSYFELLTTSCACNQVLLHAHIANILRICWQRIRGAAAEAVHLAAKHSSEMCKVQ